MMEWIIDRVHLGRLSLFAGNLEDVFGRSFGEATVEGCSAGVHWRMVDQAMRHACNDRSLYFPVPNVWPKQTVKQKKKKGCSV